MVGQLTHVLLVDDEPAICKALSCQPGYILRFEPGHTKGESPAAAKRAAGG